jgi:hypothetical protein
MLIKAYHGTNVKNIESIQKNGYNFSSDKEWLGKGIYFFETLKPIVDGVTEAISWVKYVKKERTWAVFEATIESDLYFDLVEDIEHKKIYDKIRNRALELFIKAGNRRKDFKERIIYSKLEEREVDFIRVLVDASKHEGYYSYTVRRPQLQVCVKDKRCIKENTLYKQVV